MIYNVSIIWNNRLTYNIARVMTLPVTRPWSTSIQRGILHLLPVTFQTFEKIWNIETVRNDLVFLCCIQIYNVGNAYNRLVHIVTLLCTIKCPCCRVHERFTIHYQFYNFKMMAQYEMMCFEHCESKKPSKSLLFSIKYFNYFERRRLMPIGNTSSIGTVLLLCRQKRYNK